MLQPPVPALWRAGGGVDSKAWIRVYKLFPPLQMFGGMDRLISSIRYNFKDLSHTNSIGKSSPEVLPPFPQDTGVDPDIFSPRVSDSHFSSLLVIRCCLPSRRRRFLIQRPLFLVQMISATVPVGSGSSAVWCLRARVAQPLGRGPCGRTLFS